MISADFSWLAGQAKEIHTYFCHLFYLMVLALLVVGIVVEYFKFPLGQMPSFPQLVGRVFIAAILLSTFPEFIDLLSNVTNALAQKLGDPNEFFAVRAKMAEKLSQFSISWVNVKEAITVEIVYACFALFHFSIYLADAFQLYTWVVLYIFAPLLIALYVLPVTSQATSALYRSLIEVSCWKPVWAVTATILWSTALSDINKSGSQLSFLSVICYCLILAGSLILTPFVVHALAGAGLAQLAKNFGSISLGAMAIGPSQVVKLGKTFARSTQLDRLPGFFGKHAFNATLKGGEIATRRYAPKASRFFENVPRMNTAKEGPAFINPKVKSKKTEKGKESKS